MDATQKQRAKKVAIIHLVLSLASGAWLFWTIEWFVQGQWLSFPIMYVLQPAFLLIDLAPQYAETTDSILMRILAWSIILCAAILVPLWSFCFGWIFVKLDNWLNHFPVLGKRVF